MSVAKKLAHVINEAKAFELTQVADVLRIDLDGKKGQEAKQLMIKIVNNRAEASIKQ